MEYSQLIYDELVDLIAADHLGKGLSRDVFVYRLDPKYVIKFEQPGYYQNITEFMAYKKLMKTPAGKWLAPCQWISDNGHILMQTRTEPLGWEERPKKMPRFFCDFKITNYGTYQGRVVCHDYGTNNFTLHGSKCVMRKASWWQVANGTCDSKAERS